MKKVVAFAASLLIANNVFAEEIFRFLPLAAPAAASSRDYLNPTPFNQGYVTIRASLDNPDGKNCISAKGSTLLRKILGKESEVFVAARIWGFKGVPDDRWIPIASYKFSNKDQFCGSMFLPDVVLVPLTPILPSKDPAKTGYAEQPYIRIALRTASKDTEKISTAFTSLLQVASGYATGGASNTLTKLLNVAGSSGVQYASDIVDGLFESKTEQDFSLQFTWKDIAQGKSSFPFDLVSLDKRYNETVEEALARLGTGDLSARTVAKFSILIDSRRSVFFADSEIVRASPDYSVAVTSPLISDYTVLNFPEDPSGGLKGTIASINQLLSAEAPGLHKQLAVTDFPLSCKKFIAKVSSAGFNKHDTALIVSAALTDARPQWNTDNNFVRACITDVELIKAIASVKTSNFIDVPFSAPADPEIPTNLNAFVSSAHRLFLADVRDALVSKGTSKSYALKTVFEGINGDIAVQGDAELFAVSVSAANSGPVLDSPDKRVGERTLTPLMNVNTYAAGCFVSYFAGANQIPHIGLAVMATTTAGVRKPYLLSFRLDKTKLGGDSVIPAIQGIWMFSLEDAPNQAYSFAAMKYAPGSICYVPGTPSAAEIVKKLTPLPIIPKA